MNKKILTLAIPVQNGKVLLGMKKRGFGEGKWNGFGGKVDAGETIEAAARREISEECGIRVWAMEKCGIHEFRFADKPEDILEVHVFRVVAFENNPVETEEMRPQWFPEHSIPFDSMWVDDRHWFPLFLGQKKFRSKFFFTSDGKKILEQSIIEVSALPEK